MTRHEFQSKKAQIITNIAYFLEIYYSVVELKSSHYQDLDCMGMQPSIFVACTRKANCPQFCTNYDNLWLDFKVMWHCIPVRSWGCSFTSEYTYRALTLGSLPRTNEYTYRVCWFRWSFKPTKISISRLQSTLHQLTNNRAWLFPGFSPAYKKTTMNSMSNVSTRFSPGDFL